MNEKELLKELKRIEEAEKLQERIIEKKKAHVEKLSLIGNSETIEKAKAQEERAITVLERIREDKRRVKAEFNKPPKIANEIRIESELKNVTKDVEDEGNSKDKGLVEADLNNEGEKLRNYHKQHSEVGVHGDKIKKKKIAIIVGILILASVVGIYSFNQFQPQSPMNDVLDQFQPQSPMNDVLDQFQPQSPMNDVLDQFQLQSPMNDVLENDYRNNEIEVSVHFGSYVNPSILVFNLKSVSDQKSMADVFRVFLQFAEAMKERKFDTVELSYKGKTKFEIDGNYFQTLGEEYSWQNPVYTMRTFSENLKNPDGTRAYPKWTGGLLGVAKEQIEDFNDFHMKWYLEDLSNAQKP